MHISVRKRWGAMLAAFAVLGVTVVGVGADTRPAHADYGAMVQPVTGNTGGLVGNRCDGTGASHTGVDINGNANTPIVAAYDGTVTTRVVNTGTTGYGTYVVITHASGYTTLYAHMRDAPLVSQNQVVSKGQQIGVVGNTGNSFGAHLHFELKRNGTNITNQAYSCGLWVTRGAAMSMDFPGLSGTPQNRNVSEIGAYSTGWQKAWTGQTIQSDVFSAVNMGTGWGDVMSSSGGKMMHTFVNNGAWVTMDSGVSLNATSISALNVGQASPHVYAVENGQVVLVHADANGWRKDFTGITTTGKISAVQMGDGSTQIMINEGGILHQMWASGGSWHKASTGKPVGERFEAVFMGGSAPQVMTVLNGQIHQIWAGTEWIVASTGITVGDTTSLTALDMGGGFPQVFTVENGGLYQTAVINGAWTRMYASVAVAGPIDAVKLGDGPARVYTTG